MVRQIPLAWVQLSSFSIKRYELQHLLILGHFELVRLLQEPIEIGLEQAPFVFCFKFFSSFEHVKSLLIMGPNNTKNSSLKCDFLIINNEKYCQNLVLIVKKTTKFDQKTVSLLCVKTKSGAHKQLTFYFQFRKFFCRHLHSSLISMLEPSLTLANNGYAPSCMQILD